MIEPLLDAGDIQGHVLPGYAETDLVLVAVRAESKDALQKVLALVVSPKANRLTTMRMAFAVRSARKLHLRKMGPEPENPLRINVAFTRQGLDRLGFDQLRGIDAAFDAGMTGLSTGDTKVSTRGDGTPEPAHPSNWIVGGPNRPFDVLLMFGSCMDVKKRTAPLLARVRQTQGIVVVHEDLGEDLTHGAEHFGFVDGISSPGVYGEYRDGKNRKHLITTRYGVPSAGGIDFGKPGQPMVWPGRFIVGTALDGGEQTEAVPALFQNGSFLVFRRLQQLVREFREDTNAMAAILGPTVNQPALDGPRLRDLIVGRRMDGQPLMRASSEAEGLFAVNHFAYGGATPTVTLSTGEIVTGASADPNGLRCPFWAHIRKVNPRDGANDLPESAHNLQMLRRGVPFGPPFDPAEPGLFPRGLLFLGYQRSISGQFEKLNSHWMNQFDVPASGGHDLLVGLASDPSGRLVNRRADWPGTAQQFQTLRQWVIPTGGAYLFAPGKRALILMMSQ